MCVCVYLLHRMHEMIYTNGKEIEYITPELLPIGKILIGNVSLSL
jgi:hypothetical protein